MDAKREAAVTHLKAQDVEEVVVRLDDHLEVLANGDLHLEG